MKNFDKSNQVNNLSLLIRGYSIVPIGQLRTRSGNQFDKVTIRNKGPSYEKA